MTGASSGIGRAFAIELSKKKCQLILSARNEESLEEVSETSDHVNNKKSYLKLVADAIQNIQSQEATKIVISRKKIVQLKEFNLLELIERVLNLYPKAFRYVWYHPSTGL